MNQPQAYKPPFIVRVEGELIHTNEHPFCADFSCPCHYDTELIVTHIVIPQREGLLTAVEGVRIYRGGQII